MHVSLWFPQGGELTQPTSTEWLMSLCPLRLLLLIRPLLSSPVFFFFLPHFSLGSYTIFNNWSTHPRSRQQPLTAAVWSHSVISTVSQVLFPKSHFSVSPEQTEELTNACACDKVSFCKGMWGLWLTVQRAFQRVKLQRKAIRDRRSQIQHPHTSQGYLLSKCMCFLDFSDMFVFEGACKLNFVQKETNEMSVLEKVHWSWSKHLCNWHQFDQYKISYA